MLGEQLGVVVKNLGEKEEKERQDTLDIGTVQIDEGFRSKPSSSSSSSSGMDQLIYELVADEEEDAIENEFETAALRTTALKAKLDVAIDATILKLQSLKNLRRHVEKAYKFADKFIAGSKLGTTNKEGRRYVLAELTKALDQVEQALKQSSSNLAPNPQLKSSE